MRYFLSTALVCSSVLANQLFTAETPRAPIADVQAQAELAVPDSPARLQA
jgi:hypothetical protein